VLSCQLERGSGLLSLHLEPYLPAHLASLAYLGISFLQYNIIEIFVDLGFVVVMVVSLTCELEVSSSKVYLTSYPSPSLSCPLLHYGPQFYQADKVDVGILMFVAPLAWIDQERFAEFG